MRVEGAGAGATVVYCVVDAKKQGADKPKPAFVLRSTDATISGAAILCVDSHYYSGATARVHLERVEKPEAQRWAC